VGRVGQQAERFQVLSPVCVVRQDHELPIVVFYQLGNVATFDMRSLVRVAAAHLHAVGVNALKFLLL